MGLGQGSTPAREYGCGGAVAIQVLLRSCQGMWLLLLLTWWWSDSTLVMPDYCCCA